LKPFCSSCLSSFETTISEEGGHSLEYHPDDALLYHFFKATIGLSGGAPGL